MKYEKREKTHIVGLHCNISCNWSRQSCENKYILYTWLDLAIGRIGSGQGLPNYLHCGGSFHRLFWWGELSSKALPWAPQKVDPALLSGEPSLNFVSTPFILHLALSEIFNASTLLACPDEAIVFPTL